MVLKSPKKQFPRLRESVSPLKELFLNVITIIKKVTMQEKEQIFVIKLDSFNQILINSFS